MLVRHVCISTIAALVLVALPLAARAQERSSLDTAQARAFLGDWTLTGHNGPQTIEPSSLSITDAGGKVVAEYEGRGGGPYTITDISLTGKTLLLKFDVVTPITIEGLASGQAGVSTDPMEIRLTPTADGGMEATQAFGISYFVGEATKK